MGSSGDVLVKEFDSKALGGAIATADATTSGNWICAKAEPKDSRITSPVEAIRNFFKDDEGSETPFGLCHVGMQAPMNVNLEEEYGGMEPKLEMQDNPWIDATMEWHNHAIALRTAENKETCPLGDCKGGEAKNDPAAQARKGPCAEVMKTLKSSVVLKICGAYEVHLSVPCFEGEDNSGETGDLPGQGIPIPLVTMEDVLMATALETAESLDLMDGFRKMVRERDKTTNPGIKIEHNLENGTTSPTQLPYDTPITSRFDFDGAELAPMPMDPNTILLNY